MVAVSFVTRQSAKNTVTKKSPPTAVAKEGAVDPIMQCTLDEKQIRIGIGDGKAFANAAKVPYLEFVIAEKGGCRFLLFTLYYSRFPHSTKRAHRCLVIDHHVFVWSLILL